MPAPLELTGRPASPGFAAGPLVRVDAGPAAVQRTGTPAEESGRLLAAIGTAIGQIEALMRASDAESAAILEFQAAMLADEELVAPVLAQIAACGGAADAWHAGLAEQIAAYEAADDEYFRARAADLKDLHDRVLGILNGHAAVAVPPGAILAGRDIAPSRFLETDWSGGGGVALASGSAASHLAMLARARGVPMVVGLGEALLDGHGEALVDGAAGTVVLSPGAEERAFHDRRRGDATPTLFDPVALRAPAITADGIRILVLVNIAQPEDVDRIAIDTCDGVGLMRSEFLFTGAELPDEEQQFRAYRQVCAWAEGRPVVIRTIDAGGDKPVAGLTIDEANPFLGLRGIRLSLTRPDIFMVQLRALARAAVLGNLKVMLPMVSTPGEIGEAGALLDQAVADLAAEGVPAARPPLGIMVEVPAVAIVPDLFAAAAFFSIGSNDLTQYVTAAARDSEHVAALNDPRHPAVLRLIEAVARFGAAAGMEVSLCGDAASDPAMTPLLLRAGLRSLSVGATALAQVKAAIAVSRIGDA